MSDFFDYFLNGRVRFETLIMILVSIAVFLLAIIIAFVSYIYWKWRNGRLNTPTSDDGQKYSLLSLEEDNKNESNANYDTENNGIQLLRGKNNRSKELNSEPLAADPLNTPSFAPSHKPNRRNI